MKKKCMSDCGSHQEAVMKQKKLRAMNGFSCQGNDDFAGIGR